MLDWYGMEGGTREWSALDGGFCRLIAIFPLIWPESWPFLVAATVVDCLFSAICPLHWPLNGWCCRQRPTDRHLVFIWCQSLDPGLLPFASLTPLPYTHAHSHSHAHPLHIILFLYSVFRLLGIRPVVVLFVVVVAAARCSFFTWNFCVASCPNKILITANNEATSWPMNWPTTAPTTR